MVITIVLSILHIYFGSKKILPGFHIFHLPTLYFGCGHIQQKAPFPVRSTVVKLLRARPSSVVGDHTRNSRAAIFFFFISFFKLHYVQEYLAYTVALKSIYYTPIYFLRICKLSASIVFCFLLDCYHHLKINYPLGIPNLLTCHIMSNTRPYIRKIERIWSNSEPYS